MNREEILYALHQIPEVEIGEVTNDICVVFDNNTGKCFQYEFNMTEKLLASKIEVSDGIPRSLQVDVDKLAAYLLSNVDENAFLTLECLCFVAGEQDYDRLAKRYNCCEPYDFHSHKEMGVMWFDHNVCIVDVANIAHRIKKTEGDKHLLKTQREIVVTAVHELRHLMLDTNIVLPYSEYPEELGRECRVEDYAQDVVDKNDFWKTVFKK